MPDPRPHGFFITATDTEVGKTWCTLALMQAFQSAGHRVAGMKPVASGCQAINGQLQNDDALLLQQQSSRNYDYSVVNPFAFLPPIAPHIAAAIDGKIIDLDLVQQYFTRLAGENDTVLVEGIGGWRVPLSNGQTLADLVRALKLPVILVVGLRLGCISHALLTVEAICADDISLAGWVANHCQADYASEEATLTTLSQAIPAPLLGILPWLPGLEVKQLAAHLNLKLLPPR